MEKLTSFRAGSNFTQKVGERTESPSAAAAALVVYVLLGEQLLTGVIGIWGGLQVSAVPSLLHAQIVGQLLLDAVAFLFLLRLFGWRHRWSLVLAGCLATLLVAAVIKNIYVSALSAAIDVCRLIVPLLWVALVPIAGFADNFFEHVIRQRRILIVLLAAQLLGLAAGRLSGWEGSYLSGDPLTVPLVFTAALVRTATLDQVLTLVFAAILLIGSLKRTSWLSALVVIGLLALGSKQLIRRVVTMRFALVGVLGIVVILGFAQVLGFTGPLIARGQSIASSVTPTGRDDSVNQRLDEVRVETSRALSNPIPSLLFGLSSQNMRLPNGQSTHAIHNTPVFLLFGGGLAWLIALVVAGRRQVGGATRAEWLLTVVVVGTLLDSLGENMALAPSFGLALAIIQGQVRRLFSAAFRPSA